MSVHDAQLDDLYIDAAGKLWRVIALCGEPTVHVQEVETMTPDNPVKMAGGVSGYMWYGFKRIHRPPPKETCEQRAVDAQLSVLR
jgi:hypothetical protein